MRISSSEFILFCAPPAENVRCLSAITPEVELMLDGDAWDHDETGWSKQAESLKGFSVPFTVHPPAWDVNAAAPLKALRDAAAFLNKKAIEFCREVGGSQIVYHPGYYDRDSFFSKTRALDFSYRLLDELIAEAKPLGITVAFENIAGPSSTLFTEDEFIHALDGIDPCAKFLLDVGHANMNAWNIPRVIDKCADRLCAFHLHDNNGSYDAHQPICVGTIDWKNTFAAMKQLPDDVIYVMEYASGTALSELEKGKQILENVLG